MEDPIVLVTPRLRLTPCLLLLAVACSAPPQDEGPAPPEVTLRSVELRSYHGSTLSAVGHAETMSYERASADVLATAGSLNVFRNEAVRPAGAPPPATLIDTRNARGNLLSRGIDTWGGVRVRTPTGLDARTERAHLDSLTLRSHGDTPVTVTGAHGYWLHADAFEMSLREEFYEFVNVQSRVSSL
jgi:hypothetical protein